MGDMMNTLSSVDMDVYPLIKRVTMGVSDYLSSPGICYTLIVPLSSFTLTLALTRSDTRRCTEASVAEIYISEL